MKKILFINFGGLGDEILFLPAVISVKKTFPDSEITLALEPRSKGIFQLTNIIDNLLFADVKKGLLEKGKFKINLFRNKYTELLKLLFQIRARHFDMVISSGANKFISVFLFLTSIKQRYGYNTGRLSEILLTKAVKLNKNQYAVNMYHNLVDEITEVRTELPELSTSKKETVPNTVLIHPGVSLLSVRNKMIKTIKAEVWAQVISGLADKGKKVILAGGPDDKETIDIITKHVPENKFENMFGKTKNLNELAELISSAEKFVCSDSAPLHIASALGVKTYVIFGSTDDKKLVPPNGKVVPLKAECSCPLRPCLWERRGTTCETLECLNFKAEDIISEILK